MDNRGEECYQPMQLLKDDNKQKNIDEKNLILAIKDVSVTIHTGGFIILLGSPGNGNITLLNILSGLIQPTEGTVRYKGENIANWTEKQLSDFRLHFGYRIQMGKLFPNLTVLENIELAFTFTKLSEAEIHERSVALIEMADLTHIMDDFSEKLSNGKQLCVSIVQALINRPTAIFADAPTQNLDEPDAKSLMTFLKAIQASGISVILATHKSDLTPFATHVIQIRAGRLVKI
ncbi:MAG: ABC transporter ATP-binding protein [Candidatus Hodarchaeota archaeon]